MTNGMTGVLLKLGVQRFCGAAGEVLSDRRAVVGLTCAAGADIHLFLEKQYPAGWGCVALPVLFSASLTPRTPSFKVTPFENEFLCGLLVPFFLICSILLPAMPFGIVKWFLYPPSREVKAPALLRFPCNLPGKRHTVNRCLGKARTWTPLTPVHVK